MIAGLPRRRRKAACESFMVGATKGLRLGPGPLRVSEPRASIPAVTVSSESQPSFRRAPSELPPGPPPRKSVVDSLRYYGSFFFDPLGFVEDRFERYGDVYYAPSKSGGLYVLKHPDHLRELLSTQASKFRKEHTAFEQLGKVLGEGLLTSDGEMWKRQRRLVQPAFARSRLAGYAETMVDEARRSDRKSVV